MLQAVLRIQAGFYVLTGLWPVVSLGTFELVTGPKQDDWLVRTTGLLIACIGLSLWVGARSSSPDSATLVLAVSATATLAAVDLRYALPGDISRIYLLDATAKLALLGVILSLWIRKRRSVQSP